jgi:methylglutaconyl-CoA hydratase
MPLDLLVADHVATITFGNEKSNSLPGPLLRQLATSFDDLATREDAHVIVLRSEGGSTFCAGASFDELKALKKPEDGQEFFSGFAHLILAMRRCPKFIVTRVQGRAAGGGVGIISASDYAIATANAGVRLSELALGLGPFVIGPVVERRVGHGAYAAMSVDADWRDAAWAERHGLYAKVVNDASALDDAVDALARRLASCNPDAMAELKKVFWGGTEHWDTLLFERATLSGRLALSEFTRRAVEAFGLR